MSYYVWIIVNAIFIIISTLYIWLVHPPISTAVQMGKLAAQIAVLLFIVNINMHFIFRVIKKSDRQQIRIMLAKFSRKMMKWHVPIAIVGTTLILIHAGIMISQLGSIIGLFHYKMITGYIAVCALMITLIGGYRRARKSSGFRRRFHLIAAMIFGTLFILHIFII